MRKTTVLLGVMAAVILSLSACKAGSNSPTVPVTRAPVTEAAAGTTTDKETPDSKEGGSLIQEKMEAGETAQEGMETGNYPDASTPQYSGVKLKLTVEGEEIIIAMYDNTAVDAFLGRLPLQEVHFYDLMRSEKPADTPAEPFSIGDKESGYDLVPGEMVIYHTWGHFTIFYGDFEYSDELFQSGKMWRSPQNLCRGLRRRLKMESVVRNTLNGCLTGA